MKKPIIQIAESLCETDNKRLLQALQVAEQAHGIQIRKSGEPYIIHPLAVAEKLWNKFGDLDLTIAALLHDTVEDSDEITIEQVYADFGDTIGFIVDAVDKNKTGFFAHNIIIEDKIERLIWAGMKDIRCLLVKIADREHNIETLQYLKDNKQVRMAFETQAIFEPLKKVLHYNTNANTQESEKYFTLCLHEKNLLEPSEIKKCLYSMSFKDFSNEMFNLVYNNSDKVVWEIEDKNYLEHLLGNESFEEHATIESMWTDGSGFKAQFTFDKGYVIEGDVGLKVATYKHS